MTAKSRIRQPFWHTCHLCNESVNLQTAKSDENGKAVHEECYIQKTLLQKLGSPSNDRSTPPPKPVPGARY
jgi:hypothetical protein